VRDERADSRSDLFVVIVPRLGRTAGASRALRRPHQA